MTEETILLEESAKKKKMGTGAKVAIGCGSGCLVVVLLIVAVVVAGAFYVKNMISNYEADLKSHGFETVVQEQMLNVVDPVTEPILFKGQVVRIMTDCSTNIAVLAQACEIHGTIEGKLYFRGQMLTIHPGAELLGGADVQAQLLLNNGKIEGEMTGKYQLSEPQIHSDSPE